MSDAIQYEDDIIQPIDSPISKLTNELVNELVNESVNEPTDEYPLQYEQLAPLYYAINEKKEVIKLLTDNHNKILVRLVSVSDKELADQLHMEYLEISEQLNTENAMLATLENEYHNEYINILKLEDYESTMHNFKICPLLECLSKTNLIDISIKDKLRMPRNLSDRRELCLIANYINKKITVYDLSGNLVDTIGKPESDTVKLLVNNTGEFIC